MNIRHSSLAGQWYPGDCEKLKTSIQKYLKSAENTPVSGHIAAIIVPHAGHAWSGPTAAAAYKKIAHNAYDRVFILCPNHRMPVHGAAGVSSDAFETPLGEVPVDAETMGALHMRGSIQIDDAAHHAEHAIEIQLPFLQVIFEGRVPPIVPLIIGDIGSDEAAELAAGIREKLDARTLVIISSDFLHYGDNYGYVPFGAPVQPQIELYDSRTIQAISALNADAFEEFAGVYPHAACGINALRVLEYMFEHSDAHVTKLAYDTSGRLSGDDDMSVSYVAMAVSVGNAKIQKDAENKAAKSKAPMTENAQAAARLIVRRALQAAVEAQAETPMPDDMDLGPDAALFKNSYGVFVTLNEANGELRGCIGNILPAAPLAESLWGRAQDAALNDPRFDPVRPAELPYLKFEISVLTKPEPIAGPENIVIGQHGVVLKKGFRSAVFLPQVAPEQGWDVETMLTHLSLKAGLSPDAWREGASFSAFEAQVF